jgi:hypothetical protein
MSRRILSALLALVLVVGFAAVTKADVTGSFDLKITLNPEGTQTEAVKFEIDLQSNLVVNVTLSGLTFGADLGFGVTGVEFAVLSVNTNLGALAVSDQFVFAEPFGCVNFGAGCPGNAVFPMGDGDGDGVIDRAVGFVKKRIGLELNIAGITLSNLAMFEDVDFPDINPVNHHEHDHFTVIGTPYFLNGTDTVVDNQTPTFGFGDVITVSGQTVSGITIIGSTALCASGVNTIKKKSWLYEVNKACTAAFGSDGTPLEGGAKTPLLFEEETLTIAGVEIGGVDISMTTTWVPNGPVSSVIDASFTLLDLADITVRLTSDNITSLSISRINAFIVSGNLALSLTDNGGDLSIDKVVAVLSVTLNQNQNPADLTVVAVTVAGAGLVQLSFSLGISRGPISVDTTTTFAGDSGELNWVGTDFAVSADVGTGLSFSASLGYTPSGMGQSVIQLGVVF